ncbi:MAG TPA: YIP1 family protein [Anaerolineae bacterium]|nr:YIP1 family protein [Anaerolineae bacterium]HNU05422.1 YIP1 family protein [Anaerolineae bacterium]
MHAITKPFVLLWDALFLQRDAYARMRDDDNPFVEGLYVLAVLGVALGLVGVIGATLEWASSPNVAAIRDLILTNLQQMPWWQFMQQNPQAEATWYQIWNGIWDAVQAMSPSPASSLLGIVTTPLGLIVVWLIYGLLAYLFARLLGGLGTLNQTLGATALAAAPQLLNLLAVLPFVAVFSLGTWTLLCNYMALRTVHDLSWQRSVAAALLPSVVFVLLISLIAGVAAGALMMLLAGGVS